MRKLKRWLIPSLALLGTTAAIATAVVPSAAGDTLPGMFVIGDGDAASGTNVTFWGAQWWKDNSVEGSTRQPFKGFALDVDETTCTFSTRTGNSTPPPDTLTTDEYGQITVIVTDSVVQTGDVISGTIIGFVLVNPNGGYDDNPGHYGTGTVVSGLTECRAGGGGGIEL
jgi:hypothetical protein